MRLNTLPLPLLAVLAGCGGDSGSPGGSPSAPAEVMEGTISDAMLPLATVRSQPPLLPPEPGGANPARRPAATPAGTPAPAAEPAEPSPEAESAEPQSEAPATAAADAR
ncbi:MAG: hypothetical protein H5U21_05080 [Porphyrobacter sp.]|nr:hypothetical protein [Porphyrobacter sp.]